MQTSLRLATREANEPQARYQSGNSKAGELDITFSSGFVVKMMGLIQPGSAVPLMPHFKRRVGMIKQSGTQPCFAHGSSSSQSRLQGASGPRLPDVARGQGSEGSELGANAALDARFNIGGVHAFGDTFEARRMRAHQLDHGS